jgi:hypothetical protein
LVDGAVELPEPLDPPMFGQFAEEPVCVLGWVVPPLAFGAGDAEGSAARTTAVPPTTRRPTVSAAVAIVRRRPPNVGLDAGLTGGIFAGSAGRGPGDQAGCSFQSMQVLLVGRGFM